MNYSLFPIFKNPGASTASPPVPARIAMIPFSISPSCFEYTRYKPIRITPMTDTKTIGLHLSNSTLKPHSSFATKFFRSFTAGSARIV